MRRLPPPVIFTLAHFFVTSEGAPSTESVMVGGASGRFTVGAEGGASEEASSAEGVVVGCATGRCTVGANGGASVEASSAEGIVVGGATGRFTVGAKGGAGAAASISVTTALAAGATAPSVARGLQGAPSLASV